MQQFRTSIPYGGDAAPQEFQSAGCCPQCKSPMKTGVSKNQGRPYMVCGRQPEGCKGTFKWTDEEQQPHYGGFAQKRRATEQLAGTIQQGETQLDRIETMLGEVIALLRAMQPTTAPPQ